MPNLQALPAHRKWWGLVAVYAAAILVVSVIPTGRAVSVGHLDKVAHVCEYLLFAWLLVRALRAGRLRQPEYVVLDWIFASSYGLLIELLQSLLPWRSAELWDALMNALGAAVGCWAGPRFPRPQP